LLQVYVATAPSLFLPPILAFPFEMYGVGHFPSKEEIKCLE